MPVTAPPAPRPPVAFMTMFGVEMTVEQQITFVQAVIDAVAASGGHAKFVLYTSESGVVPALKFPSAPAPVPPPPIIIRRVRVTAGVTLRVRAGPSPAAVTLGTVTPADGWFAIVEDAPGWYRVSWRGQAGWLSSSAFYVDVVQS